MGVVEKPGYVYFIRKDDRDVFKIGMTTKSPESRLTELQSATSDKLTIYGAIYSNNPRKMEKDLHKKFSGQRVHGEWFSLSEGIVRALTESNPPDWVELRQGQRLFWFQISTNILYVDYDTLLKMKFSHLYLATILSATDRVVFYRDGNINVEYDLLIDDWPELASDLMIHKVHLLSAAQEHLRGSND